MCSVRMNQKPESPVRTRPLSGISVGSTTSKVEIRSLATSSRRSSSSAYSSRTLPLPTCTASGMDGLLSRRERGQALEHGVDVAGGGGGGGEGIEGGAGGDLRVGLGGRAESALLVPGAHRARLHEPVSVVAREAGVDEREEQPLAEEETVTVVEVPAHSLGPDDQALDQPGEAVEHV